MTKSEEVEFMTKTKFSKLIENVVREYKTVSHGCHPTSM